MRKLMTKLLACCLVFALALTMCAGAFSVSAASTGTLTVGEVTVNKGAATAVVPVELVTDGANGYAMATYTIVVPAALQTITDVAVVCDSEANPAVVSYLDAEGNVVSVAAGANSATAPAIDAAGNINFKVDCTDIELAGPKSITVNITVDVSALGGTATLCDVYDITVAEVVAADNTPDYIDVTAVDGSVTVNNLIIQAKNAIFDASYVLRFAVSQSMIDTFGARLEVKRGSEDPIVFTAADATSTMKVKGVDCYIFDVEGIAVKEVSDQIISTVKTDDYVGETADYNLVTYALNQINSATAKETLKVAMAAFLEYVSAAQTQFGYNTENPADANLPVAYRNKTEVTLRSDESTRNTDKPIHVARFNVAYEAETVMAAAVYYGSNDITGYTVKYAYNDTGALIEEYVLADFNNTSIGGVVHKMAQCNKMGVTQMVKKVDISIHNANGEEVDSVTYSYLTYAYNQKDKAAGPCAYAMMAFAKAFSLHKGLSVDF